MNHWYCPTTDENILGHKAMKNRETKELAIFGKFGEIFEKGKELGLIIKTPTKSREASKLADLPTPRLLKKGEEVCFVIPLEKIKEALKLIRVPIHPRRQLRYIPKL